MTKILFFFLMISLPCLVFAEGNAPAAKAENNIIYKYKKHQEFDFENLDVQGDPGSALGDITVSSRASKEFKSKLPLRKNFDAEIKKALERVR